MINLGKDIIFSPFGVFFLKHSIFLYSDTEVDDLQMKELQDQLEAEQYFSVIFPFFFYYILSISMTVRIINFANILLQQ